MTQSEVARHGSIDLASHGFAVKTEGPQMAEIQEVWIFHGANAKFASGVFRDKAEAVRWIEEGGLTGVLTKYPVGISVYEWAVERGHHKPQSAKDVTPEFVARFSSAAQEHMHFENGSSH